MAAPQYTSWAKVLSIFPGAADIETSAPAQTLLIESQSESFHSFIRKIHRDELKKNTQTGDYDINVRDAVANLVIDELRSRRQTDDTERQPGEFVHITGLFTDNGLRAHGVIQAILKGWIVFQQDAAEKDVRYPEPVKIVKAGSGDVEACLPGGSYQGRMVDTYRIKFTTLGRVDAGTALFTCWKNWDDVDKRTAQAVSTNLYLLDNGLYLRFLDLQTAGDSFAVNDEWLIQGIPSDAARQAPTLREANWFGG